MPDRMTILQDINVGIIAHPIPEQGPQRQGDLIPEQKLQSQGDRIPEQRPERQGDRIPERSPWDVGYYSKDRGDAERNPKQDKPLTEGEIKELKEAGFNIHELKKELGAGGEHNLFKGP